MFMLYKLWPVVFVTSWAPLIPLGFSEDDTVLEQRRLGSTTGRPAHVLLRMFHSLHDVRRKSYVRVLPECDWNTGGRISNKKQNRFKRILYDIICAAGIPLCALLFVGGCICTRTCWLHREYRLLITTRKWALNCSKEFGFTSYSLLMYL